MFPEIGFNIKANTIDEGWQTIVRLVNSNGVISQTVPATKFLLCLSIIVEDVQSGLIPTVPPFAPVWTSKEALDRYAMQLIDGSNHGFEYTYGERLRSWMGNYDQLQYIINTIISNRYSRRAVANLREPRDMGKVDTPCMIDIQALFDGRLNLFAHFRSHDVKAWPTNAYGLAKLLGYICNKTLLYPGCLCIMSSNIHQYEEDWPWCAAV